MPTTVSPTRDVLLYFLAMYVLASPTRYSPLPFSISVVPPLAVFFKRGCAADFWINICLSILGWIPGVLHAWYIISRSEGAM
ncbi:UPF0057-domain-containing protein [Pisolithus marmoratus]|nr:UPF0057-domain-containing protein [Pisolithus marmoratus]